jgi:hypothetical protein
MTEAKKLYKGNAEVFIPPGKKYVFNADMQSTTLTDQNGMPIDFIGKSPGIINVKSTKGFWCIDYQETKHHPADEVPVEVPLEEPPNIMQRMQDMVREMVFNKYGQDSLEMETMEDAMNFDLDGDGHIGSPYELADEEEFIEEVISPTAEPAPEAQQEPVPAQTGSEEPPTDPAV